MICALARTKWTVAETCSENEVRHRFVYVLLHVGMWVSVGPHAEWVLHCSQPSSETPARLSAYRVVCGWQHTIVCWSFDVLRSSVQGIELQRQSRLSVMLSTLAGVISWKAVPDLGWMFGYSVPCAGALATCWSGPLDGGRQQFDGF